MERERAKMDKKSSRILALLMAGAAMLLFVGCGNLNDSPAPQMTVNVQWPGSTAGTYVPLMEGPSQGPAVVTVVAGAIVIKHTDQPYLSADEIDESRQTEIENDADDSAKYFVVEQLAAVGDSISFPLPPESAGPNWQLVAIGLRYYGETLMDITEMNDDAAIWFGFDSRGFLGNKVGPGDTATITMEPACGLSAIQDDPEMDVYCKPESL
ncbi:MAG: hypothetical protein OEZ59_09910 [Deltaproteobacteria bacterium]|nr:hypothetical protein [Deltaproteobacteria bacterium]